MIDFTTGIAIGVIAALLSCGAWALRIGYGDPPYVMLGGVAAGFVGTLTVAFLLFCWALAEAFKPR